MFEKRKDATAACSFKPSSKLHLRIESAEYNRNNNQKGTASINSRGHFQKNCRRGQKFYDLAFRTRGLERKIYLLEKAAWLCPIDARVHNDLGVAYYFRGHELDRQRAEDQFNIAIDLRPGYETPRRNL